MQPGPARGRREWHELRRFLLFDAIGASLGLAHCSPSAASSATPSSVIQPCSTGPALFRRALILGIIGFFLGRVYRRRAYMKELVAARLEPEDLKKQLDAGEQVYIVDLRHPLDCLPTHSAARRAAPLSRYAG